MYEFFKNLDRRWVFLLMFLSVLIPVLIIGVTKRTFPEKPLPLAQAGRCRDGHRFRRRARQRDDRLSGLLVRRGQRQRGAHRCIHPRRGSMRGQELLAR